MLLRRRANERGAAAVEFALISLILLALIFSMIQFAFFFWGYQAASSAAREGARLGAVEPCDEAAIILRGKTRASEAGPVSFADAAVVVTAPTKAIGEPLTVAVTFSIIDIGIVPGFDPQVSKSATTRIENVPGGACTP